MKAMINGVVRDLTPEEVQEMEEMRSRMLTPSSEPSAAELHAEVTELKAMIAKLTEV